MKNKKGFTLIELLAVIVILAIIALIATPIVLNMINSARKKSAESSTYGFIDAIEYNNGFAQTEQAGYTEINGTNLDATSIDVKMKGKKPTSGTISIENGKVTSANLCVEGYTVVYNGREVTNIDKGCNEPSTSSVPTISTCPGCVYAFYEPEMNENNEPVNPWYYSGENQTALSNSSLYKEDYRDVVEESGVPYFLGLKLNPTTKKIEEAYACDIAYENETNEQVFCLKGTIDATANYNNNISTISSVFSGCDSMYPEHNYAQCYDTKGVSGIITSGGVSTNVGLINDPRTGECDVLTNGVLYCYKFSN